MIKRNSVVSDERDKNATWTPYGRVVTIKDGSALVAFVTRDLEWIPLDALKEHDYKGRWDRKYLKSYFKRPFDDENDDEENYVYHVWHAMPTLRNLKQLCAYYHPEAWKKQGKKRRRG